MLRRTTIIEVIAPAGFGKTSLLGQWRREALNLGALVAWLSLEERDDVARLTGGLAYSMRGASGRPTFERTVARLIRRRGRDCQTDLDAAIAAMNRHRWCCR